jgi:hypothetical protein
VLKQNGKEKEEEMKQILEGYGVIFAKPKELPPPSSHDHRIILQKGSGPISVRPYQYPFFRKTEIEEQVKEMLERGIIRPSYNPFSSPVLLVKKGMEYGGCV